MGSLIAKVYDKNHLSLTDNSKEEFFCCKLANIAFVPLIKEIGNQENSESSKLRQEVLSILLVNLSELQVLEESFFFSMA